MYDEIQIEWGLTDEEFDSISAEKIQRIVEYRKAKAKGENTASKKTNVR